jgi:hypothetical protein
MIPKLEPQPPKTKKKKTLEANTIRDLKSSLLEQKYQCNYRKPPSTLLC